LQSAALCSLLLAMFIVRFFILSLIQFLKFYVTPSFCQDYTVSHYKACFRHPIPFSYVNEYEGILLRMQRDFNTSPYKQDCTGSSGPGVSSRLESSIEMPQHFILFNIQTPARKLAVIVFFLHTNGKYGDLQPRHTIIDRGI